jgi:tetratricopeptide (TPR) repeat protein
MPQHARRVKVRRKDLRKPDEFETLTGQAFDWAERNRPVLFAIAGAALVVAIVALGVARWRSTRNEAAAAAFRNAQGAFAQSNWAVAAQGFAELAETYPSAPFGRLGQLYHGHALARQGDHAGAATAYGEYLATNPAAEYLRQEALLGLGRAKEAGGDAAGALEAYTQAGELAGPYRTDALLGAARLHEASGRADEARTVYESLLKDASDPQTKALVTRKLAAVGQSRGDPAAE